MSVSGRLRSSLARTSPVAGVLATLVLLLTAACGTNGTAPATTRPSASTESTTSSSTSTTTTATSATTTTTQAVPTTEVPPSSPCPIPPAGAQAEAPSIPDGGKTVALTFDDGPGPSTSAILSILESFKVRATFFDIGTQETE